MLNNNSWKMNNFYYNWEDKLNKSKTLIGDFLEAVFFLIRPYNSKILL